MALRRWRALWRAALCIGSGTLAAGLVACNESLDGSSGCPLVCANSAPAIQTVTLNGIALDTTVPADLGLGSETRMLLSSRGDTLDTRVIARFDSLPMTVTTSTTIVPITSVDSVYLRLLFDSLAKSSAVPITVSVYDVDTSGGNDTAVATLAPLFTQARLLGTKTFAPGTLFDTASIALSSSAILAKIQGSGNRRLRVGLQIASSNPSGQSVSARIYSTETLAGPRLTMRVSSDTSIPAVSLTAFSRTPVGDKIVSGNISDFTLFVIGTPVPTGSYLAVGGVPVSRTYFRFNLPSLIVDSAVVVRATLLLTQVPAVSPDGADTMLVQPNIVVAGGIVTDPARAAQIISGTLVRMEPLVTHPPDNGVKEIEIAPVFGAWALQNETEFPHALVLRSGQEILSPQQALFYSSEAADTAVRPKLRVSYTLRSRVGAP